MQINLKEGYSKIKIKFNPSEGLLITSPMPKVNLYIIDVEMST
jgi:hypothetical protein